MGKNNEIKNSLFLKIEEMDSGYIKLISKSIFEDCVYLECDDIFYIYKYILANLYLYGYDVFQADKVFEYISEENGTRFKIKDKYDRYSVILKMSKKEKSLQVINSSRVVFHDSDDEYDQKAEKDMSEDEDLEYPDTYHLPLLFIIDKKDKERLWKIWTVDNVVHRVQGLVDGKKQPYKRSFQGKNIGKKNETSPEEQAKQEAEKTWIKQIDKGYYPKCKEGKAMLSRIKEEKEKSGGHNINASASIRGRKMKKIEDIVKSFAVDHVQIEIKPMKAYEWELADEENPKSVLHKVIKYFDFEGEGVYMQWKLDGFRCIARTQKDITGEIKCVLTTNNKKQFRWFEILREEIIRFLQGREDLALDGLDGELYCHTLHDEDGKEIDISNRFNTIQGICGISRKEPHILENQINLVVFDLVDLSGKLTQDERFLNLKKLFKNKPQNTSRVQLCDTKIANFMEEMMEYHDEISQDGYEGVIIRSRNLKYSQKRCQEIRKYKYFIDREYPIIDAKKDEGVDDEYFVWVCQDPEIIDEATGLPKRFRAKQIGSREKREDLYENYLEYLGRMLTVKFQEYTADGIPRFPRAVGIRDDQ